MDRTTGTLKKSYNTKDLTWIKLVGIGNCNVGKTTLIKHFCESKFTANYQPTVGVDYGFKVENIMGSNTFSGLTGSLKQLKASLFIMHFPFQLVPSIVLSFRINIWDLSGNADYFEVRNELYSKTDGIFLVFDVTNNASFDSLDQWFREIAHYSTGNPMMVIVGNKTDLKLKRSVNPNDARKLSQNYKCQYFETSAATGEGVNEMFKTFLKSIITVKNCNST